MTIAVCTYRGNPVLTGCPDADQLTLEADEYCVVQKNSSTSFVVEGTDARSRLDTYYTFLKDPVSDEVILECKYSKISPRPTAYFIICRAASIHIDSQYKNVFVQAVTAIPEDEESLTYDCNYKVDDSLFPAVSTVETPLAVEVYEENVSFRQTKFYYCLYS